MARTNRGPVDLRAGAAAGARIDALVERCNPEVAADGARAEAAIAESATLGRGWRGGRARPSTLHQPARLRERRASAVTPAAALPAGVASPCGSSMRPHPPPEGRRSWRTTSYRSSCGAIGGGEAWPASSCGRLMQWRNPEGSPLHSSPMSGSGATSGQSGSEMRHSKVSPARPGIAGCRLWEIGRSWKAGRTYGSRIRSRGGSTRSRPRARPRPPSRHLLLRLQNPRVRRPERLPPDRRRASRDRGGQPASPRDPGSGVARRRAVARRGARRRSRRGAEARPGREVRPSGRAGVTRSRRGVALVFGAPMPDTRPQLVAQRARRSGQVFEADWMGAAEARRSPGERAARGSDPPCWRAAGAGRVQRRQRSADRLVGVKKGQTTRAAISAYRRSRCFRQLT